MSTETLEVIRICEALPAKKRAEVADFARFLLGRTSGNYGLSPGQLDLASKKLYAKAQKVRREGTAKRFAGDLEAVLNHSSLGGDRLPSEAD
jgi:hypothetical protein